MSADHLAYKPDWYLVGDADKFGMAIAYGVIALATLYQVESLAEQLLSRGANPITLQDISCLIAFKSSSWLEVFLWMFRRPSETQFSWTALKGVILRICIILIDLGIIMASIPREVDVFESQVGYTELSFGENATSILSGRPGDSYGITCLSDNVPYKSFSPAVKRQICMDVLPTYATNKSLNVFSRFPDGFDLFRFVKKDESLGIESLRAGAMFSITHSILYVNYTAKGAENRRVYYKLPDDIVQQASASVFSDPILNKDCVPSAPKDGAAFIGCNSDLNAKVQLPHRIARYLFLNAGTRTIRQTKQFTRAEDHTLIPFQEDIRVGSVNRPRLGIFPALIVFGILFVCSCVARLSSSESNVMLSLFTWFSSAYGFPNVWNPFYTSTTMGKSLSELIIPPDPKQY